MYSSMQLQYIVAPKYHFVKTLKLVDVNETLQALRRNVDLTFRQPAVVVEWKALWLNRASETDSPG